MLLGGRYRVVGFLGGGGEAEVVAGADTWQSELPVAIKRVTGDARRLAREYTTLRSLHHPALVEALDFVVADGSGFLVEARIEGEPLATWARGRSPLEVVGALCGAAQALAHLHARSLVHGDVHPGNLLVPAHENRAMLIDLGLARPMGARGAAGTLGFVAPEVLRGEAVSAAADVYGLAASWLAVLAGEEAGGTPVLAGLPEALRALSQSCLKVAPGSRPGAMELARRLAEVSGLDVLGAARPLPQVPVCGRDLVLARIDGLFADGRGCVHIEGRVGSGKSSLLAAAGDRAVVQGFHVLRVEGGSARALPLLVARALSVAAAEAAWVRELGADLADLAAHPRLPAPSGRARSPHETAELAVVALDALAAEGPTLVVVDDAHLAQPDLAQALAIWRRRVAVPRLVVLTAGEDAAEAALSLEPLTLDAVREMLRLAYAEERPAAEAERLRALCGGWPLALTRALAVLAASGKSALELEAHDLELPAPRLDATLVALAATDEAIPEAVMRRLQTQQCEAQPIERALV
ncbi:MAG: protein kinase, partial [Deltaproteobacteria bacterium]|nr:protein kinase [Deltaproteobacteria bacterium]